MALDVAAQLLTTALMLLQTVSANPSFPQSVRDQAQGVAESAITAATRAMAQSPATGAPSCTITSDKYNYYSGEVIVFNWQSTNASKLEFVQDSSDVFPTPAGELLGTRGDYRKVVDKSGYHFLGLKATGASGESNVCSAMVSVR